METERFFADLASRLADARQADRRKYERFFHGLAPRLDMARKLELELDRHLARRFNVFDYLRRDELGLSRIVADLTSFILWLLGLAAAERKWARHFQANTKRCRPVLSTVFPGQGLWRNHPFKVPLAELFDALKCLKPRFVHEVRYA